MPKRTSKEDVNTVAASIVGQTTGATVHHQKNPAAVSLGRLGGLKGGKARADKLTPEKRKEIAQRAALIRWKKK